VVTVAVVGLVEAGVIGFPAAIGAVLGANVGTTATAQLMAFSTGALGWLGVGLGIALLAAGRPKARAAGQALLGLGLVFLGLETLGTAFGREELPAWLPGWLSQVAEGPVEGVLAGTVFTGLIQSSTLFIGLVMSLAAQNLIGLAGAVHLVLGGNIGSCLPGVLAGAASGRAGFWAGLVNLGFNVAGVAAVLPFVGPLAGALASTGGSLPRQVANAHALFNLVTALAALPLAGPVGRWLERGIAGPTENRTRSGSSGATRSWSGRR
ncbi:MAG TPA: Na/Pi cotransporter family protein, partial [Firmicutes bacterium]|nr:Na/Pi cotransporter family protein [Bacillota bacterium]